MKTSLVVGLVVFVVGYLGGAKGSKVISDGSSSSSMDGIFVSDGGTVVIDFLEIGGSTKKAVNPLAEQLYQEALDLIAEGKDSQAVEVLNEAGEAGSLKAWHHLGEMFQFGEGVEVDFEAALHYYNVAAGEGYAPSQAMLSTMHSAGMGVEGDEALAILYASFAGMGEDTTANMALGYRHWVGAGVPKSCEIAANYYRRSAKVMVEHVAATGGGKRYALERLSDVVAVQDGTTIDDDGELVQYYSYLAAAGNAEAQAALGQLHWQGGRGVEENPGRAVELFERAALGGDGGAMANLGHMHSQGWGVDKNNTAALKWYKKGVAARHPSAMNGLAYMYMNGAGVEKNVTEALRLFKDAAELGSSDAMLNLGVMYYNGENVKQDYSRALHYFVQASHQDHTMARYYLGLMHLNGLGTGKACATAVRLFKDVSERGETAALIDKAHEFYKKGDFRKAIVRYRVAAELGYEVAQFNAGFVLAHGHGFSEDTNATYAEALRMFQSSADQGNLDSRLRVGDMHYYGIGAVADPAEAATHYRLAADAGNAQATYNLGYMHEYGDGLPQDFYLAKRYYDQTFSLSSESSLPAALALIGLLFHFLSTNWAPSVGGLKWDLILLIFFINVLLGLIVARTRVKAAAEAAAAAAAAAGGGGGGGGAGGAPPPAREPLPQGGAGQGLNAQLIVDLVD